MLRRAIFALVILFALSASDADVSEKKKSKPKYTNALANETSPYLLMHDGRPVIGGTYWPREDKKDGDETYPGFKTILTNLRDAYKDDPKNFDKQADKIAAATTRALENPVPGIAIVPLNRDLIERIV